MSKKTRVIFCTYSSIYSSIVLKQLLDADCIDVVGVVNSTRLLHPKYGPIRGSIEQIRLTGLRYSLYLFAITDLYSISQFFKKEKAGKLETVHRLAAQYGVPVINTDDINQQEPLDFVAQVNPEYLLAAHFNQLIKSDLLNSSKMTCINIHPSLLPSYKGVDPVFFAQLDNCESFGVSLHKMEESFDTGEILLQDSISASSKETTFLINKNLFFMGANLAIDWICQSKAVMIKPQVNVEGNYDSWPTRQQMRQFKASGNNLLTLSELFQ